MKKRIFTLALAIIMVIQTVMPVAGSAKEIAPKQNKMVKVGSIDIKSYPQLDLKKIQENRQKILGEKWRKYRTKLQPFSSPYFPGQDPSEKQKPLIYANVNAIFTTKGLDGGKFNWEGVFGKDSDGKVNKAQIVFEQLDNDTSTRTGVKFFLKVDKDGKYTWSDGDGKPTKLPLYSKELKPYKYEVLLDEDVTDHVKLLTARFFGTEGGYSFGKPDPATGEIVGNINLDLSIQQIASTKFTSKWNTGVEESNRPIVEGSFLPGNEPDPEMYGIFKFPSNDTDKSIVRNDKLDPNNPGEYSEYRAKDLAKTPKVDVADPDPDSTDTYTLDRDNKKISYKGKTYKYDLKYDAINGGKLTITEILPVTFDANGGKFASITEEGAEQKIVKEVEYDGTLTDKAEEPKKELETFKGWSTTEDGKTPVTDADFKNIKEAKTFYAIWDNNPITAEELEVKESFKDGTGYVNDFIPTLDTLKGQVKIKDASGTSKALTNDYKFVIVEGTSEYTTDEQLKTYLYNKLQEKKNNNDEPTRIETVKAKVTHKNGTSQTVDIQIKVIKNIYEAKTLTERPYYVPDGYKKVTVDPTTKAQDPQKTYYYVNPKAQVVIPGKDPVGVDGNTFTKWLIDGTDTVYELAKKPRHKFENETTIKAQYSKDVIPQEGGTKPEGTPDNFVKVTFVPTNNGTLEGNSIFYVNPDKKVTIPVANPVAKQYYTFKEWKIGVNADGAVYIPSTPTQFTDINGTTITATYEESKNIIPYNPEEPITRPDGYVRVTFAADPGLKLTVQKAYYVKANAGVTLGNAELAKPGHKEETGYEFEKWDKEDSLVIADQDVLVTAKAKVLPDFDTKEHPEYVKVTFKAGENGVIKENGNKINEKVYYVNPNKYVNLKAPTPEGNIGYDFSTWKSDKSQSDFSLANFVNYKEDTTITAMFNQKDAVYPKLDGSTKPDGYVEVTFKVTGTDGKIADKEITTYYVDPNRDVSLKAPKTIAGTGFVFDEWRLADNPTAEVIKPADKKYYQNNTTIYGSFKKLDDIIPATNDDGTTNLQPDDYVAVLFIKGEHAQKFEGQVLYYVNPKANPNKTIGDLTKKPKVTPDTGWKYTGWNKADTTEIKDYMFVVAQYEAINDVIEKIDANTKKPDGYVTVTFKAGDNGKLDGITEKVYYVNPNKYVKLNAPNTVPDTGFVFGSWKSDGKVFSLDNFIKYEKDTTITANFNLTGNVIPKTKQDDSEKPAGFVTVNFVIDPATGGKIEDGETITYFVKNGEAVTIHPPKTKADTGYEFDKWDKDTTTPTAYTAEETTVKGSFKKLDDIIKSKEANGTINAKPEGYVTVQFLKGDHGVLDGQTTFYVNPNAGKKLEDLKPKDITIVPEKTYKFDKWNKDLKTIITENTDVTAEYTQLPNIIKAGPKDKAPVGYVVVIFETDGNGTITGNKEFEDKTNPASNETEIVYFVNPDKGVKLAAADATASETVLPVPSATPYDATKYGFDKWLTSIDTDTTITRGRVHIAIFKPNKVTMTYDANGATEGTAPEALSYDVGTEITLAGGKDLKKDNYVLTGWKIGETTYAPGAKYKIEKDTTATAVWEAGLHTVEFDTDGAGHIPAQKVKHEELIKPVDNPQKDGYFFIGWKVKGTDKVFNPTKDKVTGDLTLVAQYSKDVIPQDGDEKPNTVPEKFVEVKFVPTDKAKDETVKIYWVNPEKEVTIPVNNPVPKPGFMFNEWKIGDVTTGETYKVGTPKKFTDKNGTTITATYNESENIKPFDPKDKDPMVRPEGYVRVTFDADLGLKLTESKAYYVKKNAGVKLSKLPKPSYDKAKGYDFDKWDKEDTLEIKDEDVVVTAKAKLLPEPECKGGGVVYVPSIAPKDSGKRADVDKSAKYLEVKYMQGHDNMFMPYKSLSRAEAAQILANALISDGYKYLDIDANTYYSDLKPNAWYLKAVSIVTQAGVFEGFDGKFMPDRSITQGEWIATLVRFQMQGKMKGNAMRVNERHWAKEEVQSAYSVGWLKIYTDGTMPFNVDKAITREEVAAVTNRAFNRVRDFEYELKNENRLYNFKDISRDMWSYYDILCATNTFVHNKKNYLSHEIDYRKYTADYKYEDLIVDHFQRVLRQKNN